LEKAFVKRVNRRHGHPHREILAFNVACADMRRIGIAVDDRWHGGRALPSAQDFQTETLPLFLQPARE
jgi:hypothetical protein